MQYSWHLNYFPLLKIFYFWFWKSFDMSRAGLPKSKVYLKASSCSVRKPDQIKIQFTARDPMQWLCEFSPTVWCLSLEKHISKYWSFQFWVGASLEASEQKGNTGIWRDWYYEFRFIFILKVYLKFCSFQCWHILGSLRAKKAIPGERNWWPFSGLYKKALKVRADILAQFYTSK